MKRFSFVAKLGGSVEEIVEIVQKDSVVHEVNFAGQDGSLGFGIGHALAQLGTLGLTPSEKAVDLTLIAALVNAGDTRVSRSANAQDGWTREIDLYIPVSVPDLWRPHGERLTALLRFLTGDRWRFFFRPRPKAHATLVKAVNTLPLDTLDEVCLFSGGLDSLIGVIDLLKGGKRPLLVSHYWDSETAKAQAYLLSRLETRFPGPEIRNLRVRLGFDSNDLGTGETENTQRGRSFLFFALAALAGSALGRPTKINVPENGLIALNVPLDPLRFGALSTRTAHPHFIAGMNALLKDIQIEGTLVNPYRHATKGEMVENCADLPFLQKEAGNSMSCSSPAKARFRGLSPRHCGYCVPCLIRRASLDAGLGIPDPTQYAVAVSKSQPLFSDRKEGEHVRSFQLMAKRIVATPALSSILVHKPGPLGDSASEITAYADVFRRGVIEVGKLLDGVVTKPH